MNVYLCTVPAEHAQKIAETLVNEEIAACVNLIAPVTSVYRWKGAVETASEVLLVVKTRAVLLPALNRRLRELHPYEVFELLALPVVGGHRPYLQWVEDETRASE